MTERTFNREENPIEFGKLEKAARVLTALETGNIYYNVQDCYFDYGQDWMWTTIIKINPDEEGIFRSCQAINSRQWKNILNTQNNSELLTVVSSIVK